jgi:hypothetical protein
MAWSTGSFFAGMGASIAVVLLAAGGGMLICSRVAGNEYAVVREVDSPSAERRAVLYTGMGGGAAGWCRQYLAIVPKGVLVAPRRLTRGSLLRVLRKLWERHQG